MIGLATSYHRHAGAAPARRRIAPSKISKYFFLPPKHSRIIHLKIAQFHNQIVHKIYGSTSKPHSPSPLWPSRRGSDIPQHKPTATENPFEKPPTSAVVARSNLEDSSSHAILAAPYPDESSSILKAFPRTARHESKRHRSSASCEPSTPDSP